MPDSAQTEPARVTLMCSPDLANRYDVYFSDGSEHRDLTSAEAIETLRAAGWDPAKIWAMPRG